MESNKEDFVDLLIFFSLWCRDPLVTAKLPIAKGEVTYEIYSTEITYTEFEILINEDIEKLKSGPWNFIEWHRYNILPVEIKLCTYAEGRLRPTERLLTTTEDIKNALSFIMDVRGPEHFAVKITMYEGDEPPADSGLYEEEVDPSTASVHHRDVCEICGRRHGVGKCILAHGGIKIISGEDSLFGSGDENEDWGSSEAVEEWDSAGEGGDRDPFVNDGGSWGNSVVEEVHGASLGEAGDGANNGNIGNAAGGDFWLEQVDQGLQSANLGEAGDTNNNGNIDNELAGGLFGEQDDQGASSGFHHQGNSNWDPEEDRLFWAQFGNQDDYNAW